MRLSSSYFFTLREDSKDEDSTSGNLMVKSGMIEKVSSGIYAYLPLGYKALKNIEEIVREEMNNAGAQELVMPSLLPEDVYISSGRRELFGSNMFSLKDRYDRSYALGPTHEEMFTIVAKNKIRSYKDMPFNLYQIANKYRDETRPRYGLIRVREFKMKDAYSFDKDMEGLDISYQKMFDAYHKIFQRVGLDYKVVRADTGVMGGLLSEEFQAITDIGEDILVLCDSCDYASNIEVSACVDNMKETKEAMLPYREIETKNVKTIEELVDFLGEDANKFVKSMVYKVDDKFYLCLVEGDREVNETKVLKLLNGKEISLATEEEIVNNAKSVLGFVGPVNNPLPIIMDSNIKYKKNYITGSNKKDYHLIQVNNTDFTPYKIADIRNVKEKDICPKCGGKIHFKKGIEVGNTFKLGTKYAEKLSLTYLDQNNKANPVVMGCYGIGIGRILASVVEQYHDDDGICMPLSIAPYKVGIVLIDKKNEEQVKYAEELYKKLQEENIDVMLDDRDERPGVKFKDMDLIGVPIRITVGRGVSLGKIEYRLRSTKEVEEVEIDKVLEKIKEELRK